MASNRGSAVARTASILGSSVLQYGLAFAASALVSRLLGPAGRGAFYLPVLGATTVLAFCKLGLDQANIYLAGGPGISIERLSAQNALVSLVMGGIGFLVTMALPWFAPGMFAETPVLYLLAAAATVPLGIHWQLSSGLLSLAGQPKWHYRAGTIGAVAQIALVIALLSRGGLSPGQALAASLLGTAVSWAVVVSVLRGLARIRPAIDAPLFAQTLRNALILHVASLLLFLHLRLDMYMVKAWLGIEALGLYSLSAVLAETLMLATESVALAILPGQVADTMIGASARALRASRAVVVVGAVLALGWAVLGVPVIRVVFGAEYAGSYLPLVVLLPGMIALGVQRVCSAPALKAGRPLLILGISAASLVCNAVLNVFWIPRYGLVGASAASTVSYVLSTAFFYAWSLRASGAPAVQALWFDGADRLMIADFMRTFRPLHRHDDKHNAAD